MWHDLKTVQYCSALRNSQSRFLTTVRISVSLMHFIRASLNASCAPANQHSPGSRSASNLISGAPLTPCSHSQTLISVELSGGGVCVPVNCRRREIEPPDWAAVLSNPSSCATPLCFDTMTALMDAVPPAVRPSDQIV